MRGVTTLKAVCICADCVAIGSQSGRGHTRGIKLCLRASVRSSACGSEGAQRLLPAKTQE